MSKSILVTGGNSGIGFALCKQLVTERGCRVFLGARSQSKGEAAVQEIVKAAPANCADKIEFVQIDVASDESVISAAEVVRDRIAPYKLYAVVNNAGTGLVHNSTPEEVMNTNLYGVKRVCDAFLPVICSKMGRIVNVGSGSGPSYVQGVRDRKTQKMLCSPDVTWEWIDSHATSALGSQDDTNRGYGLSKALVTCYTAVLARDHPNILSSCISPGFIATGMTKGYGASKMPEEGTVSIMHCLFEEMKGNGWYYGSDALRSPLHFMRNPGEPVYDGKPPFDD